MLRLLLVRHGQTEANVRHYLQGASDGPLTEEGRRQIAELGLKLKDVRIDRVISSDLIRARDTAEAIAEYHGLAVEIDPLVREWDCGDIDGQPAEVFRNLFKQPGFDLATFRPGGGENLVEVTARAKEFLDKIVASNPALDQIIVVCSHGDFIRMTMRIMFGLGFEEAENVQLGNASYHPFEFDGRTWEKAKID